MNRQNKFAILLSGLLAMPAALTLAQTTNNSNDTNVSPKVEEREKAGKDYSKEGAKLEKDSQKVGGKYGKRMHREGKMMHKHGKKVQRKAEKKEMKEERKGAARGTEYNKSGTPNP